MLNESSGYYQIGPEARCSEQFLLSVTVSFAANLPQVIYCRDGVYFQTYNLLLCNEVFYYSYSDKTGSDFDTDFSCLACTIVNNVAAHGFLLLLLSARQ